VLVLILGCGSPAAPEPAPDEGVAILREVRNNPEKGPARCEEAGVWANDCRVGWARVRLGHPDATRDELLPACDTDEECLFDVLDAKPDPDFLAQLDLCVELLHSTASFCQQHAANRWLVSEPSVEEQARVRAATGHESARAKALGHLAACSGQGNCEGLHPDCEVVVAMLREEPERCSVQGH